MKTTKTCRGFFL